jgi:hypothetical protein
MLAQEVADSKSVMSVPDTDQSFLDALGTLFPDPLATVTGSSDVDVSVRKLNETLTVLLVNTSGPHANAPDGGISELESIGPLTVSVRLPQTPSSITLQPGDKTLDVKWTDGSATVNVPQLHIHSVLVVEE